MPVDRGTMALLLRRLSAAFGKPFTDAKVEAQATEYAKAMGQIPSYAIEWSVDVAVKSLERYPKPAELRKLALTCPQLDMGQHDQSLSAQVRAWEADPWAGIESLDKDRTDCRSTPCPACGSVIVFSDRGAVVVHDEQRHRELAIGYSNFGRSQWLEMGPMPELAAKKQKPAAATAWRALPETRTPEPLSTILPAGSAPPSDESWDEMQQQAAEAMA